jgi:hypothetical protein
VVRGSRLRIAVAVSHAPKFFEFYQRGLKNGAKIQTRIPSSTERRSEIRAKLAADETQWDREEHHGCYSCYGYFGCFVD